MLHRYSDSHDPQDSHDNHDLHDIDDTNDPKDTNDTGSRYPDEKNESAGADVSSFTGGRKEEELTNQFESELASSGYTTTTLPLSDYLDQCYKYTAQKRTAKATSRWQSPMFEFLRLAKGHPKLDKTKPEKALEIINNWVGAREYADLFPDLEDDEEGQTEILDAWEKIKFPAGTTLLEEAIDKAKFLPFAPSHYSKLRGYVFFISIAGWLQRLVGDRPIWLPCHRLAERMGCKHTTVARFRKLAIKAGLLTITREHRFVPSAAIAEATEFRFALDRFNDDRVQVGAGY